MTKKQKFPYLVGSKWTAMQKTWGWRHFQVVNRQNQDEWVFAEMVASCDRNVRFWLNAKQLKEPSLWQPGWQSLAEIKEIEDGEIGEIGEMGEMGEMGRWGRWGDGGDGEMGRWGK